MGTRGLYVFKHKGLYYVFYNHWDSYPSWLGDLIVKELKTLDLVSVRVLLSDIEPEDVWDGKGPNRLNFDGLMSALLSISQHKLMDITKEDNFDDGYDAMYTYIIDLDSGMFVYKYPGSDVVTQFSLTDVPDDWMTKLH